jgi:nicotinamide riboside kinase
MTTDHRPLTTDHSLRVAVVGPCASGKSTLVAALREAGYDARQPAQEHSYVKDMWERLVDPDVLIYLDISYEALLARRPYFGEREYLEREKARLAHAREHADLVVDTSGMTTQAVRDCVLAALAIK